MRVYRVKILQKTTTASNMQHYHMLSNKSHCSTQTVTQQTQQNILYSLQLCAVQPENN